MVAVDGTVSIDGASAIATLLDSAEGEQRCNVEDFMDGNDDLIGMKFSDEREHVELVLFAKGGVGAGSLTAARQALRYPPVPARITFTATINGTTEAVDAAAPNIGLNGDYIYSGGARRALVKGRAALRIPCWKPKSSPMTVAQLLTLAS